MGLLATVAGPLADQLADASTGTLIGAGFAAFIVLAVVLNVLSQLLLKNPNEPPVVFHWFPLIGSTITYGIDPYKFFFANREKYGDVFTFILLGKKTTVCLGIKGNDFILNGKLQDVNAEEVYHKLTTPVFGKDVVYDCPNAKLMEQKKFVKFGLTTQAFETYVPMIEKETTDFLKSPHFPVSEKSGVVDVPPAMSELTIYTASRCLQGREVRDKFNSTFADLYHDLDMGFAPLNFMLPWLPLPHNRKRDAAHTKMARTYMDIIDARKAGGNKKDSEDMIWNLMSSVYKNGTPIPDHEVAHMMIALLMAGQHSSASTSSWIVLRLAQNPAVAEQLLEEQRRVLGADLPPLTYESLQKLTLNSQVVKETLRIHAPIHSVMRNVKSPLTIESGGRAFSIPTSHVLLAATGVTSKLAEFFPEPEVWDPQRWADAEGPRAPRTPAGSAEELVDYGYGLVSKGATSPYLPFGAGRHRCIGEQFAYLQLGAIIATLVRHVRFRTEAGDASIAATDYSSLFSQPVRPARVRWERRGAGPSTFAAAGEKAD